MSGPLRAIREILDDPFAGRGLTPRQAVISGMRARGRSHRSIAEELGIQENTVKNTLYQSRVRLGVVSEGSLTHILIRQISAVLDAKGA